jgi:hypothetical protein
MYAENDIIGYGWILKYIRGKMLGQVCAYTQPACTVRRFDPSRPTRSTMFSHSPFRTQAEMSLQNNNG